MVRVILIAAIVVLGALPAWAGKPINWTQIREVSRSGPITVEIPGKANLRVPTGFRFVGSEKLSEFHELLGDTALPGEHGILLPEEGGWLVQVIVPPVDPLKDLNIAELQTDAVKNSLMGWNESFLNEVASKRSLMGLAPLRITGWTHKPVFDSDRKRLTMGVRVSEDKDRADPSRDQLYYNVVNYGADGSCVVMKAVTSVGSWDKPIEEVKKLTSELAFTGKPPEPEEPVDMMHYMKIGGAGLIGVAIAFVGARALLGNKSRPTPAPNRPAARRFGSPR
ncbi:MAG: DUF2167 domain-containing protein [Gemmataceae bacterium]